MDEKHTTNHKGNMVDIELAEPEDAQRKKKHYTTKHYLKEIACCVCITLALIGGRVGVCCSIGADYYYDLGGTGLRFSFCFSRSSTEEC